MYNTLILVTWAIVVSIVCAISITATYRKFKGVKTALLNEIEQVEQELFSDFQEVGRAELEQTHAGRELLELISKEHPSFFAGKQVLTSSADAPSQIRLPFALRFVLLLGNATIFLRYAFVPESNLQVIYRFGKYSAVKGPGIISYQRLFETLGPLVYIGSQFAEYTFNEIFSRDAMPINVRLRMVYKFDPRSTKDEIARVLVSLPREALVSIVEKYLRWALMTAIGNYDTAEVVRREVITSIEEHLNTTVSKEIGFLGIHLGSKPNILSIELPRLAIESAETDLHRATELVEQLNRYKAGESSVPLEEVLRNYVSRR
ncbi:MAG: hypothetical protein FJ009_06050 [Chloroflexi bacterium]|nr:hypothetical protein [Chloroflexota bacterium]